jgi:hypothetical protein
VLAIAVSIDASQLSSGVLAVVDDDDAQLDGARRDEQHRTVSPFASILSLLYLSLAIFELM